MTMNSGITLKEKIVNGFWNWTQPALMFARDLLIKLKLIKHDFRQPYILGYLKTNKTAEELVAHLANKGFRNHFFAWHDPGQKYSLRLRKNFKHQYHLRVFNDNEIRGHFELTPEAHPIQHMKDTGMQPKYEDFMEYLEDWVVPSKV